MCHKEKCCAKPENLKEKPGECSPEQIRECHGTKNEHPCVEPTTCEHPEHLQGKPGDCSPEQIKECHGESAGHPCE